MKNKLNSQLAMSFHNSKLQLLPILILVIYFIVNLSFLVDFPFVHSDESWLSGFSRTVLVEKTFKTSEPFFDLYPRAIHGLRVVFVTLQMCIIKILGYSIFSVRLLSLLFSTATLYLVYKLIYKWTGDLIPSLISMLIVGVNIQFIMSAHTARQEAPIYFFMLLAFYIATFKNNKYNHILSATIIGITIGIHPNSFIIACGLGLIYLYRLIIKEIKLKELLTFIGILALWVFLYVVLSIMINTNFIRDYLAFGNQLGITGPSLSRFESFYYFYYKLFHQIGGTYKLVPIKLELIILVLLAPLTILTNIIRKKDVLPMHLAEIILMIVGINIAYILIARYNQTSIVFTIIFVLIALVMFIYVLFNNTSKNNFSLYTVLFILMIIQFSNSYTVITNDDYESYDDLKNEINLYIPDDAHVLANLNLDYHFDLYQLYDYRNLMMLTKNNMNFENYITKNDISFILLYEEMQYIKNSNGKWDILYGPLDYYDDMVTFLDQKCRQVNEFESDTYGVRIARYVNSDYPWYVKIYEVMD